MGANEMDQRLPLQWSHHTDHKLPHPYQKGIRNMKSNLAIFSGVDFKPVITRRLLILLLALELILAFSALGFFQAGNAAVSVTFVSIIIVLAAMLFGPLSGAAAGLIFGLCRLWRSDTAALTQLDRLFSPWYSGDFAASFISALLPNVLSGLVIGLAFNFLFSHLPKQFQAGGVAFLSCMSLYFHRFLSLFVLWWEFPKCGLTVSRALSPGLSGLVLLQWGLGVVAAVGLYRLFTNEKILALLKKHQEISEEPDAKMHRTIAYSGAVFLALVAALFFYVNSSREAILQTVGTSPVPQIMRVFTSLSLQTVAALAAAMVIVDLALLWQHETNLIAKKAHEQAVRELAEKNQQDQRQLVTTMSSIYCETYYIDLPADHNQPCTFTALKQDRELREIVPPSGECKSFVQDGIIHQVIEPESQEAMLAFLDTDSMADRLLKSGGSMLGEFRHKIHGWCRAYLIVAEKDEENRPRRVLLAIRVIDEQKRQEIEMQEALTAALDNATSANAAKGSFLARMSHDLRTPMNDILGITTIAGTHLDDIHRVKDCLNRINQSGKQLLFLINEILDMSQIEAGGLELISENFSLPELLDDLSPLINSLAAEKKQTLEFKVSNFYHEEFVGDSRRIQQIFMSLADNAIRFTPEGGSIKITAEETASNRLDVAHFKFTIQDTGYGIREEDLHNIFEPFFLSKDPQIARLQGSGLGLPIAQNLARMMLGDIQVQSEYGKGSTFTATFSLPIYKESAAAANEANFGLKVLAVSDQPIAADATCETMKQLGVEAQWIVSDEAAISRAVEAHESGADFDAIICDWDSSSINNIDIISALRRQLVNDTPALIAASNNISLMEREAKESGVSFLINKPLFKSRLRQLFADVTAKGETAAKLLGAEDEVAAADFSGARGLLVEDNELNAEIAAEILGMLGMTVDFANNGQEAVDKVSASADGYYDVVFMDIQMPLMDGYEATKAIRKIDRDYTRSLPIFAMSANALAEDIIASKESGMNEHISKPVDYDQLTKLLKRWLRK